MEFLRITLWSTPMKWAVSVVNPQDFVVATIDEFIHATVPVGAFYTKETFEFDAFETDPRVMVQAMRLFDEKIKEERNMAVMFFYDTEVLKKVKPRGVFASDAMAPLTADQVTFVLEQTAKHPNYEHQTRIVPTKDGFIVTMRDGAITKTTLTKDSVTS